MGRLIDADMERNRIYSICKSKGNQFDKRMFSANDIMEILNSSPTAFDVDAVEEQIHEYFKGVIDKLSLDNDPFEVVECSKDICEIVRRSGME